MAPRTIRITVETETLTIVRQARTAIAWCSGCRAVVEVIAVPTASLSDPETSSQLQQWMQRGRIHIWHSSEGTAQICLPSLLQSSAQEEERPARLP